MMLQETPEQRQARYEQDVARAPTAARRHLADEKRRFAWTCPACDAEVEPDLTPLGNAIFEGFRLRYSYRPARACPACGQTNPDFEQRAAGIEAERMTVDVAGLLKRSGLVGRLARSTFDTFEAGFQDRAKATCEQYARLVAGGLKSPNWLLMSGHEGSGKSHLAAAIAHHVIGVAIERRGYVVRSPARVVGWARVIEEAKRGFNLPRRQKEVWARGQAELWDAMTGAALLVIDDLDKVAATPWSTCQLYTLLEERSLNERATVLTCNADLEAIKAEWVSILADRNRVVYDEPVNEYTVRAIFDRIVENTRVEVGMQPKSYRRMMRGVRQ